MSVYDWAHYTTKKGAVKMHTLLDYDCLLPEFVNITTGKTTDNKAAYDIPLSQHSIVVAEEGIAIIRTGGKMKCAGRCKGNVGVSD